MSEKRNLHIAIFGANKFDCLQLVLYGFIKNLKMLIMDWGAYSGIVSILKPIFFITKYRQNCIEEYRTNAGAYVGAYKGLWYELNKDTIDLTSKFYSQQINNEFIAYYNNILNTNKFEAYIKKIVSFRIFALLKELHLIRFSGLNNKNILIIKTPISELAVKYMEDKHRVKYRIKWVMPLWDLFSFFVYYGWLLTEFVRRGVVFNKAKTQYKLSGEAAWGFHWATLRDDIVIADSKFTIKDILLLEFNTGIHHRTKAFTEAKMRGFDTVSVPRLRININKNIFNILFFYLWVPIKGYFQLPLRQQSYLAYYIFLFHRECFPIEILMNLYQIKCHISKKDNGDVASTIILNKYGTKNMIFHWSDLTVHKAYNYAFSAHNIYFAWGDIHYDYHCDNYFVDKKINVGCIFKNEYNKAVKNRENIIAQLKNLKNGRKIVTFFSTMFDNSGHVTEYLLLEYLEIIKEFCLQDMNTNVLLKPKVERDFESSKISLNNRNRYEKVWNDLFTFANFSYIDPLKWSIEEIISISDVCINMGINTPSTLALICGKNALYFDNTGNNHHPFAKKYKNVIVFEDKNTLLRQIDNILKGKFNYRDVIDECEIEKYDAFRDDRALERIRDNLYELTSGGLHL